MSTPSLPRAGQGPDTGVGAAARAGASCADPGSPPSQDAVAAAALSSVEGIPRAALGRLFERHGGPAGALRALQQGHAGLDLPEAARAEARALPLDAVARRLAERGTTVWWRGHPEMPVNPAVADAPAVLFAEGRRPDGLAHRGVAIVGTRSASPQGQQDAHDIAVAVVAAGATVISGLAIGIDAAAHEGALAAAGTTIGVVATGLDVVYPRRHAALFAAVREQGLILGEQPFGSGPQRWKFPVRNRIIVMLSDVVVVVESKERGGAMSTAHTAAEAGITVFAVPGSRRNPVAAGTNRLIADGAVPLLDPTDVLPELSRHSQRQATLWHDPAEVPLSRGALRVFAALHGDHATIDELAGRTGMGAAALSSALHELEAVGRVARHGGAFWAL